MSQETGQNVGNHAKVPRNFHIITGLVLVTIILGVTGLVKESVQIASMGIVTAAISIFLSALTSRLYSTSLQDRIIKTEMKLRLRDILDADLLTKAESLSLTQLIALRFASDTEMPGLIEKVLSENITKGGEIKKLVTDWQGDYRRV